MVGRNILLTTLIAGLLLSVLGACEDEKAAEAKYLRRGIALFEEQEFKKARVEFKNALRINPDDAEGWYRMGLVDEVEGNLRGAFANFTHAVEQDPSHTAANIKIGNYHFMAEELAPAESRAEAVLALDPDNPDAHALKGAVLLRKGESEGAKAEAQHALERDATHTGALSVLAGYHLARGESDVVLDLLEKGIAAGADDVALLLLKARIHEKRAEIDKVVDSYERIFAAKPNVRNYRTALADFLSQVQRPDEAEAVLRAGVAAMPDDTGMKLTLTAFLEKTRGIDAAEAALKAWIDADSASDPYYFALADLYIRHNAVDRAVALLQEVVKVSGMEPAGLNAQVSLAQINFARGNKQLAEKLLTAVLKEDPRNAEALYVRAGIGFNAGRLQEVIADLRVVLGDKPTFKPALQLLAEALLKEGDMALAIDSLSQAVDVDPIDVALRTRLAQLHHARGDTDVAMKLLQAVTGMAPRFPVAWETIARIKIETERWNEAEAAIATLRDLSDQDRVATYLDGLVLRGREQFDAAAEKFTQVARRDSASPLAAHAINALVALEKERGHLETVVALLEDLVAGNQSPASLHTTLGRLYALQDRHDLAARQFDLAIVAGSRSADPFLARAVGLRKDGKMREAIEVLHHGSEAIPSDQRTKMLTAEIMEQIADYDGAIAAYEDVLAANSMNHVAANNLAALLADYKYTDPVALERARRVAERFVASENPIFLDTLGWVCFRQNKVQQALIYLRRATAGGHVPPQLYFHLGATLAAANQSEEAKAALQKAVASATTFPGIEDARRLLANL